MNKKVSDANLSINWTAMIQPAQYKLIRDNDRDNAAKFEIEPLERGYSTTLGNCLRRVLMSSLYGTAIAAFRIEGVSHEYSTVENIKEDVIEIVLNLKSITFKGNLGYDTKKCSLIVDHEGDITADMIQTCDGLEVTNPKQIICTTTKKNLSKNRDDY
jgi:DNA-directed RNA polymerase subunit alpha